jgi:two-component system, OmpR family, phosphate regulon sensor histidine kinase PhoR
MTELAENRSALSQIAEARGARRLFLAMMVTGFLGGFVWFAFGQGEGLLPAIIVWLLPFATGALWLAFGNKGAATVPPLPLSVHDTAGNSSFGLQLSDVMLDGLPTPVFVVGPQERVLAGNMVARAQFPQFRPGVPLASVLRAPEVHDCVIEVLNGHPSQSRTFRVSRPEERYIRAVVNAVDLPDGERCCVVALQDDTEVQRATRSRAQFLANASHELRTPLASLSGFIDTLRGHARDDPRARDEFLKIMAEQAERMRRLIDDLLSLSRIEQNEHVPPQAQLDLVQLWHHVQDALMPLMRAKGLQIEAADIPESASIRGDRDELTQVLQNLLDNAIKYSPEGSTIHVRLAARVAHNGLYQPAELISEANNAASLLLVTPPETVTCFASLMIRDEGPGVPRTALPQLSHRFYRVNREIGSPGGTGLGLAIVKHVLARHRGGFVITSAEGHGTAAQIFLPCLSDCARDTKPSALVEAVEH